MVDLTEDTRLQVRRFAKGKPPTAQMTYLIGGGEVSGSILKATQRGKLVDFPVKPWERLAEPSSIIGENDTQCSQRSGAPVGPGGGTAKSPGPDGTAEYGPHPS